MAKSPVGSGGNNPAMPCSMVGMKCVVDIWEFPKIGDPK